MKNPRALKKGKASRKEPDPRLAPVLEAIAAAAAVMDGETRNLEAGAAASVPEWAERKRQAEAAIKEAGIAAAGQGLEIAPGSPEAEAVEGALAALRTSVEANMLALEGHSRALRQVVSALKSAAVKDSCEGMYSRSAAIVAAAPRRGFGTAV